jgi:hypothetical protein
VCRIRDPIRARTRTPGTIENIRNARQVATEGDVEDEGLIGKVLAHRARISREERHGGSPVVRVGVLIGDICWYIGSCEMPDANPVFVPECRIHCTTGTIQPKSIALRVGILDTASAIEIDTGVADGGSDFAGESIEAGALGVAGLKACIEITSR